MAALTTNANVAIAANQAQRKFPVGAAVTLYRNAFVGLDPAGLAKAFVPGDMFVGINGAKVDNSAGAASAEDAVVSVEGDFVYTITSVANTDTGRAVYATDDNTLAFVGHPDAFVGRVLHKFDTNKAMIRMKTPGATPLPSDGGSLEYVLQGTPITVTGAVGDADIFTGGVIANSHLGLGVLNADITGHGYDFSFDAVAEIAQASIRTPECFLASNGCTLECTLHLTDIADSNTMDADWGFVITAGTQATQLDILSVANSATFHMDGASANILAQAINASVASAVTDTTIDNVTTALAYKKFKVIVRPSGACEFWIDGVRALASTSFTVATTARFGAIVNMEKTSNDTLAVLRMTRFRAAGAAAV